MAPLVINGDMSEEQERALSAAAAGLPDDWRVAVQRTLIGGGATFEVRITGPGFTEFFSFAADAHPIELAHYLERTKDQRT